MAQRVGASSLVSSADAEWLISKAGLNGLESMVPLEGGWDNTNLQLMMEDGSSFVLKAWYANTVETFLFKYKENIFSIGTWIA